MGTTRVLLQCPFVGLRPFGYNERDVFFGRDEQIDTLEDMIARKSLISIIGSSGSGKSSLIRAGLLPRLAAESNDPEEKWNWVAMRPGDAPIRALAEAMTRPNVETEGRPNDPVSEGRANRIEIALRASSFGIKEALEHVNTPNRKIAILIDQFEEIFRFADVRAQMTTDVLRANEQREETTFFVQLLLNAASDKEFPGRIILTMRSDFIGDCARFHGLSLAVTESQYLVPALTRDQRAEVIRRPVESAGGTIEPALVQRVLNDTNEDPDQLPVLQHAMMRTWQRAETRGATVTPNLRLDHYAEVGGIEDAISNHANEILAQLGDETAVKRAFQSLTDTDALGRTIRRPQRLDQLAAVLIPDDANEDEQSSVRANLKRVVEQFAHPSCSFLRLPEDRELDEAAVVDIGHEALIRRWDKLGAINVRNWVREEQEDGEELNDLIRIARLGQLLPPDQLAIKEEWWNRRQPNRFWAGRHNRNGAERLASAAAVLHESRSEIERQERLRKRAQVRRYGTLLGLLIVLTVGVAAFFAWTNEVSQKTSAKYQAAFGTSTLIRDSASNALLFAYKAIHTEGVMYSPEMEALIYAGLQRLYEKTIIQLPNSPRPAAVAFDASGRLYVSSESLSSWDPATGTRLSEEAYKVVRPSFYDMKMSPDGATILLSNNNEGAYLVDPSGKNPSTALDSDTGTAGKAVFSPDGTLILTVSTRASPKIWGLDRSMKLDLGTIEPKLRNGGTAIAFGRRFIAVADSEGIVYLFDAATILEADRRKPARTLQLLDAKKRAANTNVFGLEFNPKFDPSQPDKLLALTVGGPVEWTINAEGIGESEPVKAPLGLYFRGAFSPDGNWLALHAGSGETYVWRDTQLNQMPIINLLGPTGFGSVAFGSDNRIAVSGTNSVWIFGLKPALEVPAEAAAPEAKVAGAGMSDPPACGSGPAARTAFDADGTWAAVAPQKGKLCLFDLRQSAKLPMVWLGDNASVWKDVHFAADPDRLVTTQDLGKAPNSEKTQAWFYFSSEGKLLEFVRNELPYSDGRRLDPKDFCPDSIGGITKMSDVNPALQNLLGSACKEAISP